MRRVQRSGPHFRVCDPSWADPPATAFAARYGGRWNAPGSFGILYLNATIAVAAANARRNYEAEIATLFDLQPEYRPDLQVVELRAGMFVDAVTAAGVRGLRLPTGFPHGVPHAPCQRIGARAYAAHENGIATRSNADATRATFIGEELALFDTALALATRKQRLPFAQWYPIEKPYNESPSLS